MPTITDMHPSLARLLKFAYDYTAGWPEPIRTLAQLRHHMGVSPQTMNNWKDRGISKVGAILAAKEFHCSANAILDDLPDGWMEPNLPDDWPQTHVVVAQETGAKPYAATPTVLWTQVKTMKNLPTEFQVVLVDDAMAPKAPAGVKVKFRRDNKPVPGDAVLVTDGTGQLYCRVFHAGLHGAWEAHATNPVYPTLKSTTDQLQVVAVFIGIDAGWSQLGR